MDWRGYFCVAALAFGIIVEPDLVAVVRATVVEKGMKPGHALTNPQIFGRTRKYSSFRTRIQQRAHHFAVPERSCVLRH